MAKQRQQQSQGTGDSQDTAHGLGAPIGRSHSNGHYAEVFSYLPPKIGCEFIRGEPCEFVRGEHFSHKQHGDFRLVSLEPHSASLALPSALLRHHYSTICAKGSRETADLDLVVRGQRRQVQRLDSAGFGFLGTRGCTSLLDSVGLRADALGG